MKVTIYKWHAKLNEHCKERVKALAARERREKTSRKDASIIITLVFLKIRFRKKTLNTMIKFGN